MIEAVADQVFIPLTVGGGVNSVDDIRALLNAGRRQGQHQHRGRQQSRAVRRGVGAFRRAMHRRGDRREASARSTQWQVYIHGGRTPTGIDVVDWAREVAALGAGEILLTSMDRDGARKGFDLRLTRAVVDAVDVPVIASGGVGSLQHLVDGIIDRRRRRGARGSDLPLRRVHVGAGEGGDARPPASRCALTSAIEHDATGSTTVRWNADGLVPAIAQDAATGNAC